MLFPDYKAERVAEEQAKDRLREATTRRMLRQAGVEQPGWVSCQVCRLLSHLGHLLVVLGRRLQRYEIPTIPSAEQNKVSEAFSGK